ncbi:hypothetical protein N7520_007431 [Penicillium odoratum]|uniref:uncharacterized protein n=1 Tax=Penicillium odoratum TaxID=1167516 RepID=UPI00254898A1|nr:uncharacterized protein N7520_007431 [Penicillium odoratum]KAJ5760275.1 hypothetical protein N7520_007431 [Penicillium odoratum]
MSKRKLKKFVFSDATLQAEQYEAQLELAIQQHVQYINRNIPIPSIETGVVPIPSVKIEGLGEDDGKSVWEHLSDFSEFRDKKMSSDEYVPNRRNMERDYHRYAKQEMNRAFDTPKPNYDQRYIESWAKYAKPRKHQMSPIEETVKRPRFDHDPQEPALEPMAEAFENNWGLLGGPLKATRKRSSTSAPKQSWNQALAGKEPDPDFPSELEDDAFGMKEWEIEHNAPASGSHKPALEPTSLSLVHTLDQAEHFANHVEPMIMCFSLDTPPQLDKYFSQARAEEVEKMIADENNDFWN